MVCRPRNYMIDVQYSLGQYIVLKWVQKDSLIVSGYSLSCHFKKAIMSNHKTSGTYLNLPLCRSH